MIMKKVLLVLFTLLAITGASKAHELEPLHVDGRYLKNSKGDIVTLHGFWSVIRPDTPIGGIDWGGYDAAACLKYKKDALDKVLASGWKMDFVRFMLDGYWCCDNLTYIGTELETFDFEKFKKYFEELFLPLIDYYHEKGIYTLLYPPYNSPEWIEIGDEVQQHMLLIWDYVSSHPGIRNNPGVMFELANEPINLKCHQVKDYDGFGSYQEGNILAFKELKDYLQPVVDKIRSHCDNIIYVPGLDYQSDYTGFADYPIEGSNIGYAIHCYPNLGNLQKDWEEHKFPVAYMAPVIITETSWFDGYSYLDGEHGTTSEYGNPLKKIVDKLGNVSWNCGSADEEYFHLLNSTSLTEKALRANNPEVCYKPMFQWWNEYADTKVLNISQLKTEKILFDEFPTVITLGKKHLAKIKAEFANGMTWDISGDAEYTIADESILSIKHGVIWGLKEGTTNVTATYTDSTGQTFSRQIEVTCTLFPLTAEGFKPNLHLEGSFDEATGTFSAENACTGGWSFVDGLDISSYKYLVFQLNQQQHCWAMVRIWDDSNVWSENEAWNDDKGDIGFDFNDATKLVIDLQSIHKNGGEPMNLSHIYHIGIWVNGSLGSVSVKRVFLSNDGVTPAYQIPTTIYADNKVMYRGDEVPALTFSTSGPAINGSPQLSTIANSSSVGSFPITVERGTITNEDVTFVEGTLTIWEPTTSSEEFETAAEAVKKMKIGWNLWNTLDANTNGEDWGFTTWKEWETCWGNSVTKPELMKMIRKAGVNAIRVPVTWYPHMDAKDKVDPEWMKRVHDVVDYVIDQGMYCILNVHHDGAGNRWIIADKDNYDQYHERYEYLWKQIAEEFKDYDEHLVFEGYNEVSDKYESWFTPDRDHGEEHIEQSYKALNDYAQSFVNAVRSTGGNNRNRNLVINSYSGCIGPVEGWHTEALEKMKIPEDVTPNHIMVGDHDYWMNSNEDVDAVLNFLRKYFTSKGVPVLIGEWGAYDNEDNTYRDVDGYFIKQAKANGIATFLWGGMSGGDFRSCPAFEKSDEAKAVLKAYYGDDYEPQLLTKDDYTYSSICKLTFTNLWAQYRLCSKELNLDDYKGIRLVMENSNDIHLLINGDSDGKQQREVISSSSITIDFDKSILGSSVSNIELQNMKDGKNETTIYHVYLIKNDGTEEEVNHEELSEVCGCNGEKIYKRKEFVHTVAFNGIWAQLDIFTDDVPLKMKNYKGIRLELAEVPQEGAFNIVVSGDKSETVDYWPLNGTSTTIIFNPEIFKEEINKVTQMRIVEGKTEVKVISAWLIRQDGTEEYSDLVPSWACEITNVDKYVPETPVTITANKLTMIYGDEIPELTYTIEGATLNGTPKLSTTANSGSPVGTYPIKIDRGSVTNREVAYVDGTLTIVKAPLTITVQSYTLKQGEETPSFMVSYKGWKNGETEKVLTKQPTVSCEVNADSKPGEYVITASGAEAENYDISYVPGKLIVTEADAVVVTAKSYSRVYGEANPKFEYEVSGAALDGEPIIECEATAKSPVGTYPIVIKKGEVKNYNDTYVNGTLTITPAKLTMSAKSYTRKQGEENPTFEVSYAGFKNGETEAVLTKLPAVTCEATAASEPGEYAIIVSGAEAGNYDMTYVAGTLVVTERPSYTLTYLVDGAIYKSFTINEGAALAGEEAPTKEGYTFSGWSEIPATMPAKDVTVSGTFAINSYKLTYMIDNKVYKEATYEYGAAITAEAQPEGDYLSFEWVDLPETMPAKDVVVHASYTTGIVEALMAGQRNVRIYSPNGRKRDKLQKGLNIVVFDDGTVHKVVK